MALAFTIAGGVLFFLRANYGRHSAGAVPSFPAALGWALMESPSLWLFAGIYALGPQRAEPVSLLLACAFAAHYLNRALVGPLRMRGGTRLPLTTTGLGFAFNLANATLQAGYLSFVSPSRTLSSPLLWLGLAVMVGGAALNVHSDEVLRRLRQRFPTGYHLPEEGLHRYVASPNYLGEIVEWLGYALAAGTPGAVVFAWATICNLAPRAYSNWTWYRSRFPDYPATRRVLIPYVW